MPITKENVSYALATYDRLIKFVQTEGRDQVIQWRDRNDCTILHLAVTKQCTIEIIKFLIYIGVDLRAVSSRGGTALHFAKTGAVVKTLVEAGSSISARNIWGDTPLHWMCYKSRFNAAAKLLEISGLVLIDQKNKAGRTAFYLARLRRAPNSLLNIFVEKKRALWLRMSAIRVGLAAADVVKAKAVKVGKTWQL